MRHDAMRNHPRYRRVGNYRTIYGWGFDMPLEKVQPKAKVNTTPDKKLVHSEAMLKTALTREKRATTLRKKWESRVRYYTKRAAEPPSPPKPEKRPTWLQTLAEFVESCGFRLEEHGRDEYEVFTKDGYQMGDGVHSRICHGIRDVRETVDVYQFMVEPCPDDCDCREE
jgi:hypothetical protein